jgi:hypothetical protein
MIEKLTAKPGVIALRMQGHVSQEDVAKAFDLLAETMQDHPKVNFYIEVASLTGFDTEALVDDIRRGWGLLDKLDRFDRVAIASDQAWVRWATRIESALLPGVSYRTYSLAERKLALDWVQGREDLPYGHAIKIIPTTRADAVGIEVNGRLAAQEIAQLARELNAMRHKRPIKAMLVHIRSLGAVDAKIVADPEYIRMKLGLLRDLDRYAVVGGPGWLVEWLELVRPLLRLELHHFAEGDEAAAWLWLGAEPLAPHSAAA